jgi:hypothetical protein
MATDDEDDFKILEALPKAHSKKRSLSQLPSSFKSIEVLGFNVNRVPAITNLTYFMNQSLFLQGKGREQEAATVDFMTCQLLITTKRPTQAAELYRKM